MPASESSRVAHLQIPPTRRQAGLGTLLAAVVTILTWGSAFAGIRVGLGAYTPAHLALLRFAVASLALAAYAAATHMPLPARRDLPGLALIGAVGIAFYNLALNYGQMSIPAGTASLLIASTPVWLALLAGVVLRERLTMRGWLGIGLSFGGVTAITLGTRSTLGIDPRALVVLSAALASALYSLGQRRYLARYSPLQCTAYAIWSGALLLLPFGRGLAAEVRAAPSGATLAVLYLGLFPAALGYMAWSHVLARLPAAVAGSLLYLVPAMALFTAWVWLAEVPALLSLLGGVLVLAGVIVVNRWGRRQH
jgi:drug/metabolite transporter (DMT)-like permease